MAAAEPVRPPWEALNDKTLLVLIPLNQLALSCIPLMAGLLTKSPIPTLEILTWSAVH